MRRPHLVPMNHEYALLGGFNRTHLGRWLAVASGILSGAITFVALRIVDLATRFGWDVNLTPSAMSLLGAGVVYISVYFLFSRWLWSHPWLTKALKAPNLAGTWQCDGITMSETPEIAWHGVVTIEQDWDRIRVHSRTAQSSSVSISAALQYDPTGGHRLLYHYRNEPRPGEEKSLAQHHGFAELVFRSDKEAEGHYFNGRGRQTFGRMMLTRENV